MKNKLMFRKKPTIKNLKGVYCVVVDGYYLISFNKNGIYRNCYCMPVRHDENDLCRVIDCKDATELYRVN